MDASDERMMLAKGFHANLAKHDWDGLRALFADNAVWTLPGDNAISGPAVGGDAVVERAKKIARFGLHFEFLGILQSRESVALRLHNTAERGEIKLDEQLAVVIRSEHGRITEIESFMSDIDGMNRFFVE